MEEVLEFLLIILDFTYNANLLIEELFPQIIFRIEGNHIGGEYLNCDDS